MAAVPDHGTEKRVCSRYSLTSVINVTCALNRDRSIAADLLDVSRLGCSLRIPLEDGQFGIGDHDEILASFRFGESTSTPLKLKPLSYRTIVHFGKRYAVIGCSVDNEANTYPAYARFVEFLAGQEVLDDAI